MRRNNCAINWKRNDGSWETNAIYPRNLNQPKGKSEPQSVTDNIYSQITSEYEAQKVEDRITSFRKVSILTTIMLISNSSGRLKKQTKTKKQKNLDKQQD